jgi:hypothetical protein
MGCSLDGSQTMLLLGMKAATPSTHPYSHRRSLPGTILATPSQLPFFAMYRRLSARRLLAHTYSVGAAVLAPALALFPKVADDPQLFEALLGLWQKRASFVTRVEQVGSF